MKKISSLFLCLTLTLLSACGTNTNKNGYSEPLTNSAYTDFSEQSSEFPVAIEKDSQNHFISSDGKIEFNIYSDIQNITVGNTLTLSCTVINNENTIIDLSGYIGMMIPTDSKLEPSGDNYDDYVSLSVQPESSVSISKTFNAKQSGTADISVLFDFEHYSGSTKTNYENSSSGDNFISVEIY